MQNSSVDLMQPQLFKGPARAGVRPRISRDGSGQLESKEHGPEYDEEDSIDLPPQERDIRHKQACSPSSHYAALH